MKHASILVDMINLASKRMFLANMKIGLGRKLYICCGTVHLLKRDVGIERGEILSPTFLAFVL
jgi:hypothetical protein